MGKLKDFTSENVNVFELMTTKQMSDIKGGEWCTNGMCTNHLCTNYLCSNQWHTYEVQVKR